MSVPYPWVTPYPAVQRHASGDYPALSQPGEGLPAWTRGNQSLDNADVVPRPYDVHDGHRALDVWRAPHRP